MIFSEILGASIFDEGLVSFFIIDSGVIFPTFTQWVLEFEVGDSREEFGGSLR